VTTHSIDEVTRGTRDNWEQLSAALFGRAVALHGTPIVTEIRHTIVAAGTAGLWRVWGSAGTDGQMAFTLVVKRLMPAVNGYDRWRVSEEDSHPFFWAREALAYREGFFGNDNSCVRSAKCYLIDESGPGSTLYLEDVQGRPGSSWALSEYVVAASRLAEYQSGLPIAHGGAATTLLAPNAFFYEYLARRSPLMDEAFGIMESTPPRLEREGLGEFRGPIQAVWVRRGELLKEFAKARLVRTHFDFRAPNLFLDDKAGQLIAVDFAFAGIGSMGHDAANLVVDDVADFFISPEDAEIAWQKVSAAYLEAASGYMTAEELERVCLAMQITVALKYAWLLPATFQVARDASALKVLKNRYGDLDEFFRKRSAGLRFIGQFLATCAVLS
jgi:hypothetical protein